MTHSTLHFAFGFLAGIALCLPRLIAAWKHGQPVFHILLAQSALSLALGILAAFPSVLSHAGVPREYFTAIWANVFLLYPIIHSLGSSGGSLTGPAAILVLFSAQYFIAVRAVYHAGRKG